MDIKFDPYDQQIFGDDAPFNLPPEKKSEFDAACKELGTKIQTKWNGSFAALIDTGKALIAAKSDLAEQFGGGSWLPFCRSKEFPFAKGGARKAERLMQIAKHPRILDSTNWSNLPLTERTLCVLTSLPLEDFDEYLRLEEIHSEMRLADAIALVNQEPPRLRQERELTEKERDDLMKLRRDYVKAIKLLPVNERPKEVGRFNEMVATPGAGMEETILGGTNGKKFAKQND